MFDLDTFIADCRSALSEKSPERAVKELVERAVAQPAEVERALGTPSRGAVIPLHRSSDLVILNLIWTPGMAVYPHDHRMWAVIGLYGGREDNTFYRRESQGLVTASAKQLGTSDTVVLGRSVIHAVANPSRQFTGAIHVYGGDFFGAPRSEWDPETLEERPYDVQRAFRLFEEANDRWLAESGATA
jgi:predicted metal-dependent enzyme (double-stranded beta helix superfamily)